MKNFLLLLLFVALPLQMTWNVAAAYCQHEEGKTAQHFGHHSHKHVVSESDADNNASSPLSGQPHTDCASCHLSPVGLWMPPLLALPPNFSAIPPPDSASFPLSIDLPGPERPQWVFAV